MIPSRVRQFLLVEIGLWMAVVSLGQLFRVPTPWPGVVVHMADVVAGFISISSLAIVIGYRINLKEYWLTKPLLGFVLAVMVSWLVHYERVPVGEFWVGMLYFVRWLVYMGMVVGVSVAMGVRRNLFLFVEIVRWALFAFGVLGMMQYLFFYDFRELAKLGWDPHLHRLAGTFLDPGFTGLWLIFGLLFLSSDEEHLMSKERWMTWGHGLYMLLLVCLGLTFSRASYVAFVAGLVAFSWMRKAWKFGIIVLALFGLIIWFAPKPEGEGVKLERTSTIYLRLVNWSQATRVIQDNLFFGVGFNRYRYVQKEYGFVEEGTWIDSHAGAGVDNSWLFVWVTTGMGGVLAYGWIWIRGGKEVWKLRLHTGRSRLVKRHRALGVTTIACLVAWGVHGMFHNSWFYAPAMGWMSILMGMCLPVRERVEEKKN